MTLRANNPALPLTTGDQQRDQNPPRPVLGIDNVCDDLAAWAQKQPNHPALDDGTTTRTYLQLWRQSGTLAAHLAAAGVTTGTPVIVWGPRSTAYATAVVAVVRAGAIVIPASTMIPDARCATMATEAKATHLIGTNGVPAWANDLTTIEIDRHAIPTTPDLAKSTLAPPGEHASIFFTSGTTGTPKAVLGRHSSLTGLAHWYRDAFAIGPTDRVAMVSNAAFVVTLRNLFGPLAAGATVCLAPDGLLPENGLTWLHQARVTVLHATPTMTADWLRDHTQVPDPGALRWALFGGEPLTGEFVRDLRDVVGSTLRVANVYGSTELGASRCWYEVPQNPTPGQQPIGISIPGTEFLVLDSHGDPCPTGDTGEISVRARNLPSGYINDPVATHELYTRTPGSADPNDRMFRTGDIGRFDEHGNLHCHGRRDDQVKISGVRVELAEVVSVIRQHPNVADAHVFPH